MILNKKKGMPDHPQLRIPPGAIGLNLQETPVTSLEKVREAIDQIISAGKATKV